ELGLDLLRWGYLLALAGALLVGEVDGLEEGPLVGDREGPADDLRTHRPQVAGVVRHRLDRRGVVDLPTDHLDEAGVARPAVEPGGDAAAVVELPRPVHQRAHLLGERAGLGARRVRHRVLTRGEPDDAEEVAVVADAVRTTEVADGSHAAFVLPRLCE